MPDVAAGSAGANVQTVQIQQNQHANSRQSAAIVSSVSSGASIATNESYGAQVARLRAIKRRKLAR